MTDIEKASGALTPHPNPLGANRNSRYVAPASEIGSDIYAQSSHTGPDRSQTATVNADQPHRSFSHGLSKTLRPFHHIAHKLGSESPFPQDLASEIQKATRVLQAFTSDSSAPLSPLPQVYSPHHENASSNNTEQQLPPAAHQQLRKNHTLYTIPPYVINSAVGLAIFTSARIGFHASLSTGSGILIARLRDGSWGPPSAIGVHSVGAGFLAGLDMNDIVVVINTTDALEAFTRARVTLGPELTVAAGPYGVGGGIGVVVEGCKNGDHQRPGSAPTVGIHQTSVDVGPEDVHVSEKLTKAERKERERERKEHEKAHRAVEKQARKEAFHNAVRTTLQRPVYTYVRSRGLYAGMQIDGSIVTPRHDANAAFYGATGMGVYRILTGFVEPGPWVDVVAPLYETLSLIEARARSAMFRPVRDGAQGRHEMEPGWQQTGEYRDEVSVTNEGKDTGEAAMTGVAPPVAANAGEVEMRPHSGHEEDWEELPKYEEDNVIRPSVGDVKEDQH